MSSDSQILAALAMKTGEDLRYFEVVTVVNAGPKKRCILCLGKHAFYFLRHDMNALIHAGGELMYAYVTKVVQDKNSFKHLLVVLSDNSPPEWTSDRLFIQSDSRDLLLNHLRTNWQTDAMWRLGMVAKFPLHVHPITTEQLVEPFVRPFIGYRWATYQGYRYMLPYEFNPVSHAISEQAGEYEGPKGVTILVQVHEQMTLEQLKAIKRDHIRWVAAEYKTELVKEESHFYVLKNGSHMKRMNLNGDIACWYAWEIVIRTRKTTLVCMLLRRQYAPPICNTAQDLAVILRIPADENGQIENFEKLRLTAHLVAESVHAVSSSHVYLDMVQAKLDALRFDEDAMEWVAAHLKLTTGWRYEAKVFVKSLIKLFLDDGLLVHLKEKMDLPAHEVIAAPEKDEEWGEIPLEEEIDIGKLIHKAKEGEKGSGLPKLHNPNQDSASIEEDLMVIHRWHARIARYLTWAVDGGILGNLFTIDIMLESLPGLSDHATKEVIQALYFMLHMRQKDMSKPQGEIQLAKLLKEPKFSQYIFNERVMQSILCTEFLKKQFGRGREHDYYYCMAQVLSNASGNDLRAYICRLLMEVKTTKAEEQEDILCVGVPLIRLMNKGGAFLATYATAALVNLSNGNEKLKMLLIQNDVSEVIVELFKAKDDDLLCYLLMLLVNITKEPHSRSVFASDGLLPLLYDILTSSYHQCSTQSAGGIAVSNVMIANPLKEKILTQVSTTIGQFCNDELYRDQFNSMFTNTQKCLSYMVLNGAKGSPLVCKAMFALKQLCANKSIAKMEIGELLIKKVVADLLDEEIEKSVDFINQTTLLLQQLALYPPNSTIIVASLGGKPEALYRISKTKAAHKIENFDQRIESLHRLLAAEIARAAAVC